MKIPNLRTAQRLARLSLARIVSEDSQLGSGVPIGARKSSKDS